MKTAKPPYVLTARRLASSRANLRKAWEKRREDPGRAGRASVRHGLYALDVRDSVPRLGESLEEFDEHARLFERAFAPGDAPERELVRKMAELVWRFGRLYRAQAMKHTAKINRLLRLAPEDSAGSPLVIRAIATGLIEVLFGYSDLVESGRRMHGHVERLIRALLRKKTGEDLDFRILSRRRQYEITDALDHAVITMDGLRRVDRVSPSVAGPPAADDL